MAENKKSFILYTDLLATVEKLPDNKAGKLFKTILQYVNDKNPKVEDILLQVAFEPIKQQLKRDLKEWDITKQDRSNNGKIGNLKRWNKDLYEMVITNKISINEAENIAKHRKTSPCDVSESGTIANIAVNVNDNVNVNVIKRQPPAHPKWNTKPTEDDINLPLPELTEGAVIQQFRFTKNKTITKQQVVGLWAVFKAQNFTGEKFYQSPKQVYSHFINWCKTQDMKDFEEKQTQPSLQLKRI